MKNYDLIIIGGGPAGLAAALAAKQKGIEHILILERDVELGGILNQCIHNGFGLHYFKEELTGPEYSTRFIDEVKKHDIDIMLNTMVLKIDDEKRVHAINGISGYMVLDTKTIILAMGCRERTRAAVNIYGSRPAGIYTAGTAQRLVNIDGYLPGQQIVILGSGDIGLIMTRRLILEGARVGIVLEKNPYPSGLVRNVVQCLQDYQVPLLLSHTVVKVHGDKRVEGVTIAEVDQNSLVKKETERYISCDTLLLSVGLIPENEISRNAHIEMDLKTSGAVVGELRQTSMDGIFACGNVLHVHDIVDFVTIEAQIAAEGVAKYLQGNLKKHINYKVIPGQEIAYVVPQYLCRENIDESVKLYLRVKSRHENKVIKAYLGDRLIAKRKGVRFVPPEMETLTIHRKMLNETDAGSIVVTVEDE